MQRPRLQKGITFFRNCLKPLPLGVIRWRPYKNSTDSKMKQPFIIIIIFGLSACNQQSGGVQGLQNRLDSLAQKLADTNKQGVTAAVNDIGIVTLPNGEHFAISVFVSNSKENNETNEKIISDISRITWDYFVNRIK